MIQLKLLRKAKKIYGPQKSMARKLNYQGAAKE